MAAILLLVCACGAAQPPAAQQRHAAHFLQRRQAGPRPAASLAHARAQHLALANAAPLTTAWQPVGPVQVQSLSYGLVTGRVSAVAIDATDATGNTVYVGTTGGGVWKSTNSAAAVGSVTFTPLTDTLPVFSANAGTSVLPSLSIGAVSVQPGGSAIVLAGTGDPNDATDSYYGMGILRSADGGLTWSLVQTSNDGAGGLHSFSGEGFAGFAWSSSSPQRVVAAVSSSAQGAIVHASSSPASVRGLYYSADAGATWKLATINDGATTVQSGTTDYSAYEGNAATSVAWNAIRGKFYAAIRAHGYYESVDGQTWTRLAVQPGVGLSTANCPARSGLPGLATCPIFRGVLAVQPVSGDLFAWTVDAANTDIGLYQDVCANNGTACAGNSVAWSNKLASTPMQTTDGTIPQGDYTLALAAVPAATALGTTDTLLFAGAADLYRCGLAGGCALRNTTNATTGCAAPAGVAPAQHAIAWQTNLANAAAPLLYFGNDGGLWRSTDGVRQQAAVCSADDATHFDNLNAALGSLAQVTSLSAHPSDANTLLVALGANGSAAATTSAQATNAQAWPQLNAAESGVVAIDQANGRNWMVQAGGGIALRTCTNGVQCTATDFAGPPAIGLAQVSGDASLIDPPALLDPALNTNVLLATCRVWRGSAGGGSAWSGSNAISPFLAGPAAAACTATDAYVRAFAAGGAAVLTGTAQNSGSPMLYAGLAGTADGGNNFGGHVFVNTSANTATASTAWTDVTTSPVTNDAGVRFNTRGFDISSIAVDPHDATGRTVYATVMGFGVAHVYRSTNAGGSWVNVSANLPDAPANSVAVDPNDAGIVYVAMDTGVYATTSIAACVSTVAGTVSNCWSVLGSALPNAPVTALVASQGFAMPGSATNGVLRAATYGRGVWQLPLLTAGQAVTASAGLSPSALSFGTRAVATTSASQTITLTNTGSAPLVIANVSASASFSETDTCAGTTLAPGATCTFNVFFTPASATTLSGSLQVFANVAGGYVSASLAGTGTGTAVVSLSPGIVTFAATTVHAAAAAQSVTVTNAGTAAVSLGSPVVTGVDYTLAANTCSTTLNAGAACTLSVGFTPTIEGVRNGTLSLADSANNHTVTLTGSGSAGDLTLSTSSLAFADTTVNATSAAQAITVTNTGSASLTLGSLTLTGDYTETDTCANAVLAPSRTCSVSVRFQPVSTGPRAGTLTFTSNSGGNAGAHTLITLNGTGKGTFNIALTPTTANFATQSVGTTSTAVNITVSNTGTSTAAIGVASVTGDFAIRANTCNATLAPQTGCTVSLVFTPTASGTRNGVFTLVDDAGTQTATLTGIGQTTATDILSTTTLVFAQQQVNTTSAGQIVTLTNGGDVALTLVAAQILNGNFAAASACGTSLAAHSSCAVTVTFTPAGVGTLTGTLQIADVLHVQTIALSGTAIAGPGVSLSPAALNFANTGVSVLGAPQTVTLTNNTSVALALTGLSTTADFGIVAGSNICTGALAAGSACSMAVAFLPTAAGPRAGALTVLTSGATQTVQLSGLGVDFSLVANGGTSATLASGAGATYPLLLRPTLTLAEPVTYACAGAPANTRCTIVAQYNDLSAIGTVNVTLLTGTTKLTVQRLAWMLPLLALPWCLRSRRKLAILCLLAVAGCGSGRKIADTGTGASTTPTLVTPSGTYTITVSATAAGLTRTIPLTLAVQ